ncbi:MAG: hypothetical protein M3N97_00755 [Pseudomonadota bacterium]|nr:hypothetical protein [Pseudomonadota bacterium]
MNQPGLPDLYEAAARAIINQRCAPAYLHDIRGSMQALFSALELLGRSAKSGADNPERVEKACELAKRAISNHEKSTLGVVQALTLQHTEAVAMDVFRLVSEVVHFLRNEAAGREVALKVIGPVGVSISAERARLQTVLVGLLMAAIDAVPPGASLLLCVESADGEALVSVDSDAGYEEIPPIDPLRRDQNGPLLLPKDLTLLFARQFLAANGGRLEIHGASAAMPRGVLRLRYPIAVAPVAPDVDAAGSCPRGPANSPALP